MASVERISYVSATLEDRPGELLKMLRELRSKRVGLSALWGFGTEPGKAQLYAVSKSREKLLKVWKDAGLPTEEGAGFYVSGADRTGALVKALEALAGAGINLRSLHAIGAGGQFGSLIRVARSDVEKAAKVLRAG